MRASAGAKPRRGCGEWRQGSVASFWRGQLGSGSSVELVHSGGGDPSSSGNFRWTREAGTTCYGDSAGQTDTQSWGTQIYPNGRWYLLGPDMAKRSPEPASAGAGPTLSRRQRVAGGRVWDTTRRVHSGPRDFGTSSFPKPSSHGHFPFDRCKTDMQRDEGQLASG